jgi:hypothetical protein
MELIKDGFFTDHVFLDCNVEGENYKREYSKCKICNKQIDHIPQYFSFDTYYVRNMIAESEHVQEHIWNKLNENNS